MPFLTSGCATHYVDTALTDVKPEQFKKPVSPKPVQLIFEFQSKGVANARVTELLKAQVSEQIKACQLFSQVSAEPVDGSVLSITINNISLSDNAFSKGFITGLTFGAAGNMATDGYICTVNYMPAQSSKKITKTVRHAIHTTVGAHSGPVNAEKSDSIKDAVEKMTRQIVSNALYDLSRDPAF
ncbi:MAG: hypothetical protein HY082_08075 [Gammaproteobacteria bacterium]|nr:hypothetical protein [Gammaproteobacteria bacterium]